jgi:hypothetical protein
MGWCSGSELAEEVWDKIQDFIPKVKRKKVARELVELFNNHDADCWEPNLKGGLYNMAHPEEQDPWTVVDTFESSNGKSVHTVSQNEEGELKCTCQGFRIQKKGFCKHTKLVEE